MKQSIIFLLAAATITAVVSCQKEPQEEETKYSLSVEPAALNFEATGAEPQTVTVTAEDVTWTAALENSADTWLNVTFDTETITVSVEDNTETTGRTARIAVVPDNAEAETAYITVNQAAAEIEYMEMTSGHVRYYGENFLYNTNGNAEYFLTLFNGEIDYEYLSLGSTGYWHYSNANGTLLIITSFCPVAEDFYNPVMSEGTYVCSEEFLPMTFRPGVDGVTPFPQYSYVATYTNSEITDYKLVTGGEYTLDIDGETYSVTLDLILEDGSSAYFKYNGEPLHDNLATPPFKSELDSDVTISSDEFKEAIVTGVNEDSTNPDVLCWHLSFIGDGLEMNETGVSGIGNYVQLQMFAPIAEGSDRLPSGTYNIMDGTVFGEYSAVAGKNDPVFGTSGCLIFIYTEDDTIFGPMYSGTISVTDGSDGNYSIVIDAMDDNGHSISVSYEGSLQRADLQ